MPIHSYIKNMSSAVHLGSSTFYRAGQTLAALGRTGFEWLCGDRQPPPVLMRRTFERMGATYIKLGQFIASSPSLFPKDYIKAFQQFLDKTEPVPFARMEKILEQELGSGYRTDIFADIHTEPLASASIAQVYAARLVTGEDVVIKIQRPGVDKVLKTDLSFLYYTAMVLEKCIPRLSHASLSGIVSEIRNTVLEECDFLKEAQNLFIFSEFLKASEITEVTTPRTYPHASSRRVLTMDRIFGTPLTDRKQLMQVTGHPEGILVPAFETWMLSVTGCKLFHADLHAGNMIILDDGRVGFIDFGIVGRISESTKTGVTSLLTAMMLMNYKGMAESMLTIGMTREKVDTGQLAEDLKILYHAGEALEANAFAPDYASVSEPDKLLLQMVGIAETHGIRFPREFTLLMKQFLYFDSYRDILFNMNDMLAELEHMIPGPDCLE